MTYLLARSLAHSEKSSKKRKFQKFQPKMSPLFIQSINRTHALFLFCSLLYIIGCMLGYVFYGKTNTVCRAPLLMPLHTVRSWLSLSEIMFSIAEQAVPRTCLTTPSCHQLYLAIYTNCPCEAYCTVFIVFFFCQY